MARSESGRGRACGRITGAAEVVTDSPMTDATAIPTGGFPR